MENAAGLEKCALIVIQPEVRDWGEFDDEVSSLSSLICVIIDTNPDFMTSWQY